MEERDDAEMRRKKDESDQLFLLYQLEKDKQRNQDAQKISESHLKQAVSYLFQLIYNLNEKKVHLTVHNKNSYRSVPKKK
jgi:hypothetical protein